MCVRCRARARTRWTGNGGLFLRDGTATLRSRRLWVLPGGGGGARGAVRVLGLGFPEAPPDSLALAIPSTASIRSANHHGPSASAAAASGRLRRREDTRGKRGRHSTRISDAAHRFRSHAQTHHDAQRHGLPIKRTASFVDESRGERAVAIWSHGIGGTSRALRSRRTPCLRRAKERRSG